jgi:pimeloyl-ACP methyl ester carboxylesterase
MTRSVLLALMLAAAVPAFAAAPAPTPNRFAASAVAAERFESGVLLVERHGQRGRPLILIPGLAGGSWVWQDAIAQFKDEHAVYVVTLPGFDGRAPVPGNMLKAAQQSLHELIVSRKLAQPVLVGHSLGGSLALAIAQQHPDLVGGVATIDGLPVYPGTEDIPIDLRPQMAEGIRQRMGGIKPDAFAAQQRQYMRSTGVVDMARADELAKLSANSDPAASVQYMGEAMALDLRPGLAAIKGAGAGAGAVFRNRRRPDRRHRRVQSRVLQVADGRHAEAGGGGDSRRPPLRDVRPAAPRERRAARFPENPLRNSHELARLGQLGQRRHQVGEALALDHHVVARQFGGPLAIAGKDRLDYTVVFGIGVVDAVAHP